MRSAVPEKSDADADADAEIRISAPQASIFPTPNHHSDFSHSQDKMTRPRKF